MTDKAISPLRRRLIEDMAIRQLSPKTQLHYIRHVTSAVALSADRPRKSANLLRRQPQLIAMEIHERCESRAHLRISYNSCLMGRSSNGELACRHRHFSVNCRALCLHNSAVLRLRRLGHRWPVTNGDEHVGDLLLGIEDAGASAERAERTIP